MKQILSFFTRSSGPQGQTNSWSPTHVHRKGGQYRLIGYGINEADRTPVAMYDDRDGTVWVRAKSEFLDGRFTQL